MDRLPPAAHIEDISGSVIEAEPVSAFAIVAECRVERTSGVYPARPGDV